MTFSQHDDFNTFRAVSEHDIDMLVLEEIHASAGFRSWVAGQCSIAWAENHRFAGAWHSITEGNLGESDLVLLLGGPDGKKVCILIENKIDAAPQPNQAARYQERGDSGISRGGWDSFTTAIIAPHDYLKSEWAEDYEHRISYEDIRNQIASSDLDPARRDFKVAMINAAIEQSRRGYRPVADPVVTAFYRAFHAFVEEEFAELKMKKPGDVPAKSGWIHYRPQGLDKRFTLRHKLQFGRVDLEMPGCGQLLDKIASDNQTLIGADIQVIQVGKAAALSIPVPEIDKTEDLDGQIESARQGAKAAIRLWSISAAIRWPEAD